MRAREIAVALGAWSAFPLVAILLTALAVAAAVILVSAVAALTIARRPAAKASVESPA